MVVGNLVIGEHYIEPQGTATITNIATGDECVIKTHGLFANKNKNEVVAQVKDPTGNDVCAL